MQKKGVGELLVLCRLLNELRLSMWTGGGGWDGLKKKKAFSHLNHGSDGNKLQKHHLRSCKVAKKRRIGNDEGRDN